MGYAVVFAFIFVILVGLYEPGPDDVLKYIEDLKKRIDEGH